MQFCGANLIGRVTLHSVCEGFVSDAAVRGDRQVFAESHLKLFNLWRRHLTDCNAGWPFWDLVGFPELVEVGIGHWNADHARLDRFQTGIDPKRLHAVLLRHLGSWHCDGNAERMQS